MDPTFWVEMDSAIDNINLVLPAAGSPKFEKLKLKVAFGTERAKAVLDRLSSPALDVEMDILASVLHSGISGSGLFVVSGGSAQLREDCFNSHVDILSENTRDSMIEMSWFSVANPDFGLGILSHEIGHFMSKGLRNIGLHNYQEKKIPITGTAFYKSLSCVANRNPMNMNPMNSENTNEFFMAEEDWADHFSAQVLTELGDMNQTGSKFPNMACAMFQRKDGSYSWQSDFAATSRVPDKHSPVLLRMLSIGIDRGNLPLECSPLKKLLWQPDQKTSCE